MAHYTLEQCIFMHDMCVKCSSARWCRREFQLPYACVLIPSSSTIQELLIKIRCIGSFVKKKYVKNRSVLSDKCLMK
ncbi:hypothetical protein C0J52_02500 [Blattella germanica]|nr:hypothetical protein C0J52_02500 [Blattella germanica]